MSKKHMAKARETDAFYIKNVPADLADRVRARAALEGRSLRFIVVSLLASWVASPAEKTVAVKHG